MRPSDPTPTDTKRTSVWNVLAWIAISTLGSFATWHLEAGGPVALAATFITAGVLLVYGLWGFKK